MSSAPKFPFLASSPHLLSCEQFWSNAVARRLPAKPLPPALAEPFQRSPRFKLQRPVSRTAQHSRYAQCSQCSQWPQGNTPGSPVQVTPAPS